MKIQSLFIDFLIFFLVSSFFILPPIFSGIVINTEVPIIIQWTFPILQLSLALFSLFILMFYNKLRKQKVNILGFRILLTIGLLFTTSLFINFISVTLPKEKFTNPVKFMYPDSVSKWIFCIMNFIFAAFYEEVIYRYYFTDTLISILSRINKVFEKKTSKFICEIIGCLVFALAHNYLGFLAVINAAIAHFILRFAYKKSNSIIPGFIAHFIYNIISLILL